MDPGTGDWKTMLDAWTCAGHTTGRGLMLGSGTKPELPDECWKQAFKDFYELRFRRKPGPYEDALEAAEEPTWDNYQHDTPEIIDQDI